MRGPGALAQNLHDRLRDRQYTSGENKSRVLVSDIACAVAGPGLRTLTRSFARKSSPHTMSLAHDHQSAVFMVSPAPSAGEYPDSGQERLRGQSNLKDFKQ